MKSTSSRLPSAKCMVLRAVPPPLTISWVFFAGVYLDAHALDLAAQLVTAHRVELFGHQHRGELDHVRFHPQAFSAPAASSPNSPPPTTAPRLLRRAQASMAFRSSIVR